MESAAAAGLRGALADRLSEPIADLVLTENRSRLLSVRRTDAGWVVRAHQSFAGAPEEVVGPLADLIAGRRGPARRRALAVVRSYHASQAESVAQPTRRPVALRPVGDTLDLRVLRDEIAEASFDGPVRVAITWGRRAPRKRRRRARSIRLGSYDDLGRLIRIHPVLDRPDVPRYVVASVVHHEMLHAVLPPPRSPGGRRQLHGPAFRARERSFPDFERAEGWIAANLDHLLRGPGRRGAPSPRFRAMGE